MSSGLNLSKEEKDTLRFLMKKALSNSKYELESIIGNDDITADQFKKILSRLNGSIKNTREIERLDITFREIQNFQIFVLVYLVFMILINFVRMRK